MHEHVCILQKLCDLIQPDLGSSASFRIAAHGCRRSHSLAHRTNLQATKSSSGKRETFFFWISGPLAFALRRNQCGRKDRIPPASSSAPEGLQAAAPYVSENPRIQLHSLLRYALAAMSCNSSFEDRGFDQRWPWGDLPRLPAAPWPGASSTLERKRLVCSSSKHPP